VQGDAIAWRQVARCGFVAHPRVTDLLFRIFRIGPEDVQGDLAVNRDGLDSGDNACSGAFEHDGASEPSLHRASHAGAVKIGLVFHHHHRVPSRLCLGVLTVAMLAGQAVAGAGQRPDMLPRAEVLVARHIEAIGGVEAYKAIQSVHARGRLEIPAQGIVAAFELFTARPARMLYRVTVPGVGRIENGYDGRVGWSDNPITGPEVFSGRQLAEAAEDAWFDGPLRDRSRVRQLTTVEQTSFDGRPAYRVRVEFLSGQEQFDLFDAETGLQIGSESSRATPQGIVPTVNVLRNYRRFGAVLQATTFVQRAMGFEQVVTLTSCEYDRVPDSTFLLPPGVAALLPQ
jgi:hypothetical protein